MGLLECQPRLSCATLMTVFCVNLVVDRSPTSPSGVVRNGRRHGPSITYKITPCWVTLLQPARRAAMLGQSSIHWPHLLWGSSSLQGKVTKYGLYSPATHLVHWVSAGLWGSSGSSRWGHWVQHVQCSKHLSLNLGLSESWGSSRSILAWVSDMGYKQCPQGQVHSCQMMICHASGKHYCWGNERVKDIIFFGMHGRIEKKLCCFSLSEG